MPNPAPNAYFLSQQSMLNKCLWQGKKAWGAFRKLIKHRWDRGLGHMELKYEYLATLFLNSQVLTSLLTTIISSLKEWWELHTLSKAVQVTTLSIPLCVCTLSIPNISLSNWFVKCIHCLNDLYIDYNLKSFPDLQNKFQLTNKDYYIYLQIAFFLHQKSDVVCQLPSKVAYYYKKHSKGRPIYMLLQDKNTYTKSLPLYCVGDRLICYNTMGKGTPNWIQYVDTRKVKLWECVLKIMLGWYLMPYHISKCNPHTSNLCWRGYGQLGTLYYLLWSCKYLAKFWPVIFHIISKVKALPIITLYLLA